MRLLDVIMAISFGDERSQFSIVQPEVLAAARTTKSEDQPLQIVGILLTSRQERNGSVIVEQTKLNID
jgi:hypothetical protein